MIVNLRSSAFGTGDGGRRPAVLGWEEVVGGSARRRLPRCTNSCGWRKRRPEVGSVGVRRFWALSAGDGVGSRKPWPRRRWGSSSAGGAYRVEADARRSLAGSGVGQRVAAMG
jgi:hypothetical protein